jgi:hypothetical protein
MASMLAAQPRMHYDLDQARQRRPCAQCHGAIAGIGKRGELTAIRRCCVS